MMFEPDISKHEPKTIKDKYEIFVLEEGILCIHYFENAYIDVDDIKEAIQIGLQLCPADTTKLLVSTDHHVDITVDAREYLQNNMRPLKAEAHVLVNLANKIIYSIFIKFRKHKHPLKAFTNSDDALKWLRKQ